MWPSLASLLAALAAAAPRTAPNPAIPPWPHGRTSILTAPAPTGWSTTSSVAAAMARLR